MGSYQNSFEEHIPALLAINVAFAKGSERTTKLASSV